MITGSVKKPQHSFLSRVWEARWQCRFPRRESLSLKNMASSKLKWTFLTQEMAEEGYSGVEVRVTQTRTEIIIMATRTENALGEEGWRIWELCCGSEEMWLPWGQCRAICWKGSHRSLCATVQAESLHYRLLGGLAVWRAYYGVLKFIMGPKAVRSWCLENSKDRGLNPWSLWMASWSTAGTLLTTMLTPPHATCCSDRVCWVSRYKDHAALGPNR